MSSPAFESALLWILRLDVSIDDTIESVHGTSTCGTHFGADARSSFVSLEEPNTGGVSDICDTAISTALSKSAWLIVKDRRSRFSMNLTAII